MRRWFGLFSLGLCLLLASCSQQNSTIESNPKEKLVFLDSATDLEMAINNGCLTYKFASAYFNLILKEEASENELYLMAAEMESASEQFQQAVNIDESEGGFQYKRYIVYRELADKIAQFPNGNMNLSFSDEVAHKGLLTWCSEWSIQMANIYDINPWSPEPAKLLPSQRKP